MKGYMIGLLIGIPLVMWTITGEEIATLIEQETVTVENAVYLVESLERPQISRGDIKWGKYSPLKRDARLTAGKLAKILIQAGYGEGGWMYFLTGWERYAFLSLREAGLFDGSYVADQLLSGAEMVGVCSKLQK